MINLISKKSIMFAVLLSAAIVSSSVMANAKREPDFERLANKLELSGDQKSQFISVMSAQHEKHKEQQESLREQRKALMEQRRKETLSSLEGVLNEEQLAEFETHMKRGRDKFEGKKMKHKNCH